MRMAVLPLCLALLLPACAAPGLPADARLLLFGEQHDQPDHQRQVADEIRALAARGALGAVVLEMAERGRDTRGLPRDADAARVREALGWRDWDWAVYEGVVMAAVRAGVPVLGGNLPREQLRAAMDDAALEGRIDAAARARLAEAVRVGHCGLLPDSRVPAMLRVQIARDAALADTLREAAAALPPGQRVLLLAGAQHVARDRGVPLHLARDGVAAGVHVVVFGAGGAVFAADERRAAAELERPDACEQFRKRRHAPAAAS